MTIKELIRELIEFPLDTEVTVATRDGHFNYAYNKADMVVNYENGTIGIVGELEK